MDWEEFLDMLEDIGSEYLDRHREAVTNADVDMANVYLHKYVTVGRIVRIVMNNR